MATCAAGKSVACTNGTACSAASGGACVFAESSPWIVYLADDDTPGKDELYAIRVADLGKSEPVKISPALGADADVNFDGAWSPDGKSYAFSRTDGHSNVFVVRFGDGLPSPAVQADPNVPAGAAYAQWSPSGKRLLLSGGASIAVAEPQAVEGYSATWLSPATNPTNAHGWWKSDDEIVHAVTEGNDGTSVISLSVRKDGVWTTQPLVSDVDFFAFELSPNGSAISYLVATASGGWDLFVMDTVVGAEPKKLAGSSRSELRWSPDGSKFLIVDRLSTAKTNISWAEGPATTTAPQSITNADLVWGDFAPGGSQLVLWQRESSWGRRLSFYEMYAPQPWTLRSQTMGVRDEGPAWSPDGSSFVMTDRASETSDVELVLRTPPPTNTGGELDAIGVEQSYHSLHYTDHGEFFAYMKGVEDHYQGAYVDLRSGLNAIRKPVAIPGDGALLWYLFQPGGVNMVYVRQLANGAQPCSFLDLSGQVASEPVQINGEGRVTRCLFQPLVTE